MPPAYELLGLRSASQNELRGLRRRGRQISSYDYEGKVGDEIASAYPSTGSTPSTGSASSPQASSGQASSPQASSGQC